MPEICQFVVPLASPPAPKELVQRTAVTATLSDAIPAMLSVGVETEIIVEDGETSCTLGATVSACDGGALRVTSTVCDAFLPAPSVTVTVIRLTPVAREMAAIVQLVEPEVTPDPPRSSTQALCSVPDPPEAVPDAASVAALVEKFALGLAMVIDSVAGSGVGVGIGVGVGVGGGGGGGATVCRAAP